MLLLSIILAAAVAGLVIVAENLLDDGATFVTPSGKVTSDGRKKKGLLGNISESALTKAIFLGLLVGAISYLTPKLPVIFSLLFFFVMIAVFVHLMRWWKKDGSTFKEAIPFLLLAFLFFLVINQTTAMLAAALRGTFWASLLTVIPMVMLIITIGYILVSMLFYNYEESMHDKEKAENGRISRLIGIILMIIIILLLVATLWGPFRTLNGDNWKFDPSVLGLKIGDTRIAPTQPTQPTATPTQQQTSWYHFYNTEVLNDNDPNNNFNFGPNPYNKNESVSYYDRSYRNRMRNDPALAAADMAWHDAIVGTRYLGTFYEECKGNWATTINTAKVKFMGDQKLFNQTLDAYFAFLDTADSVELRYVDSGLDDQMYMNGYTVNGVPDVIVMKTTDHDGWFLVYTFVIKGQKFEVMYRIDCGYQPTNVEEVMDIPPVNPPTPPTDPPSPTPTPTPPPEPTPTPPPEPTPPPTPTPPPEPTPPPTDPPKDPTQGTDVGGNDDPTDPGPPTNTGVGGQSSSEDQPTNSDHMTHEEYTDHMDDLGDINDHQQTGDQPSTPTTTTPPSTHVDDQGDTGSGHGGINDPTPVQPPAHVEGPTGEQTQLTPEQPGEAWGGPPD